MMCNNRKKKILVIEDNELNLKLVRTLLEFSGYEVFSAMDAEKGLRLTRELHPDLILMDIQLPGMDGLAATRILKKDPELGHVPIIAFTSFAMQGDEEKALDAGCDGYIAKPIDTRGFCNKIAEYDPQIDCEATMPS